MTPRFSALRPVRGWRPRRIASRGVWSLGSCGCRLIDVYQRYPGPLPGPTTRFEVRIKSVQPAEGGAAATWGRGEISSIPYSPQGGDTKRSESFSIDARGLDDLHRKLAWAGLFTTAWKDLPAESRQGLVIQPAPAPIDPSTRDRLLGTHRLSLQWISWDCFGQATVTDRSGTLHLEGAQTGRGNSDFV